MAHTSHVFTKFVGKVKVSPGCYSQFPLGIFSAQLPAKGFSISFGSRLHLVEPVITRVSRLDEPDRYTLMLHIENHGDKTVNAEIWEM